MKPKSFKYEFPLPADAWTKGAGHPAGIYLLEGEVHVAAHQSGAERRLLESGALLVANLRFDRDPLEAGHPGRPVRPVEPRTALRRLTRAERN